jgi:hypothetical protein
MDLRSIILASALAGALFSPTLAEARGAGGGGGHSAGHSVAAVADGHHRYSSRNGFAGGGSAAPKAWTAAPALVNIAAPALRTVSYTARYCASCARDSRGRIARSVVEKREFEAETGYPHGRPGYVVDHVVALKRGGADSPANMQWQTKADAKAKDRVE